MSRWRRASFGCALAIALAMPAVALAEDIVYLQGGGSIRGEIMELMPNQYVSLRMADGSTRRVEWAQVERVEEGPAPQAAGPVYVAPVAAAPSPTSVAQREALQAEITRLEAERRELTLGGPIAMMVVGGFSFTVGLPIGVGLLALGATCEDEFDDEFSSDCDAGSLTAAGTIITIASVVGTVVGLVGFVRLIGVAGDRRDLSDQINIRRSQLNQLSYDVSVGPQHAALQLRLQF